MDSRSTQDDHCVALMHRHGKELRKYVKAERQTRGSTESESRTLYYFIWDRKKQRLTVHTEQMWGKINSEQRGKACRKVKWANMNLSKSIKALRGKKQALLLASNLSNTDIGFWVDANVSSFKKLSDTLCSARFLREDSWENNGFLRLLIVSTTESL